jgi:outer membrane receptor for ferrienterochelin and colicins
LLTELRAIFLNFRILAITCLYTACILLIAVPTAYAADLYQMDEVVVTATRTEKALVDVPVRTEVVSREKIERSHARDLKQALESVPGVMLKRIHGKSGYSVWLQGMDSDRVLVLLNGEPISASTGSSVDLTQISATEIERIEIIKGASSALYGSAAMGGVINVISRRNEKPVALSLTVDGGGWGDDNLDGSNAIAQRHLGTQVAIQQNKWNVLAVVDVRESDGYDLDKRTFGTQGNSGTKSNIHTRLGYRPNERSEIYVSPKYYREDIQNRFASSAPGTSLGEIRKNKNELAERTGISIGGHSKFKDESQLSGFIITENFTDETQQDVIATSAIDQSRYAEIDTTKFELQWDQPISDNQILTSGVAYYEESLNQTQQKFQGSSLVTSSEIQGKAARENAELFIQNDIFINNKVELLLGARAQNDSDFGGHLAPKINLLYSPDWFENGETRLRTGIGTGYRVPNLKERFFVFDHTALGYKVLGNTDLEPEESTNVQLGLEVVSAKQRFDINLFYNDIDQLIETDRATVKNEPGILIFEYINVARAKTYGLDLAWSKALDDRWSVSSAYTFLTAKDRQTKNRLPDRPEHQVKAELRYDYQPWKSNATLVGIYQSEEYIDLANTIKSPGWTTWGLKVTQKTTKHLSVFFGVNNITDEHRSRFDGTDNRPDEGRFIYAGIKLVN